MKKNDFFATVMTSELKVDIYSNDRRKYFDTQCEGDMGPDAHQEPITIKLENFPPGTKISVSIPMCPECGCQRFTADNTFEESCSECGFDWIKWDDERYE